jgi:hypothetical protein
MISLNSVEFRFNLFCTISTSSTILSCTLHTVFLLPASAEGQLEDAAMRFATEERSVKVKEIRTVIVRAAVGLQRSRRAEPRAAVVAVVVLRPHILHHAAARDRHTRNLDRREVRFRG